MTLSNILFVLVLVSGLATLVILFVGVLSMGRDQAEETVGASRSNRLMVWRVRLQLITVLLMPLWYLASRTWCGSVARGQQKRRLGGRLHRGLPPWRPVDDRGTETGPASARPHFSDQQCNPGLRFSVRADTGKCTPCRAVTIP